MVKRPWLFCGGHRRIARALALACSLILVCHSDSVAAESGAAYLRNLALNSSSFRVRVQALISLGRNAPSDITRATMREALGDAHPAVRTAALDGLARHGDQGSLSAISAHFRDASPPVRASAKRAHQTLRAALAQRGTGPASSKKYYVQVGRSSSNVSGMSPEVTAEARRVTERTLAGMDAVWVARGDESPATVNKLLKQQKLHGFIVDSSIVTLESTPSGLRAVVSVIVGTYPGRDIRAMLRGAATAQGGDERNASVRAVSGAMQGALRQLPSALQQSERLSPQVSYP